MTSCILLSYDIFVWCAHVRQVKMNKFYNATCRTTLTSVPLEAFACQPHRYMYLAVACAARSADSAKEFAQKHGIGRYYGSYDDELLQDKYVDIGYVVETFIFIDDRLEEGNNLCRSSPTFTLMPQTRIRIPPPIFTTMTLVVEPVSCLLHIPSPLRLYFSMVGCQRAPRLMAS